MRHLWIGTFIASLAGFGLGDAVAAPAGPNNLKAPLEKCVKACTAAGLKEDDRATCNLECRTQFEEQTPAPKPTPAPARTSAPPTPATSTPAPSAAWIAADLSRCNQTCDQEKLSPDRATCKLQCKSKAAELRSRAPASTPAAAGSTYQASTPAPSVHPAPSGGGQHYVPSGRLSANGPMVYSPGTPAPSTQPNRAALQAEVDQCKAQCNRAGYKTSTDRETCKLTCNSTLDALPQGTVYHNGGSSAADARRAVIESSNGVAGRSAQSPPVYQYQAPATSGTSGTTRTTPPPPPAKTATKIAAPASSVPASCPAVLSCNQGCTSSQSFCVSACNDENKRATDRATCKLTCTNNAEMCAETCAGKVSLCQPK